MRFAPPEVAVALQVLTVLLELLPALHELVGALEGIGTQLRFELHRLQCGLAASFGGLVGKLGLALERRAKVGRRIGSNRVQRFPCPV